MVTKWILHFRMEGCRALHGQPAGDHPGEGRERRASLLHQPAPPHASRGQPQRTPGHPRVHLAGKGPRHRSQPPLLPRQRQK